MLKEKMKARYDFLVDNLPITVYGYADFGMTTPIKSASEYLETKDKFYSEFVVLPDGRVLEASPSHSAVIDSLLNFLYEKDFPLSFSWLVEERLYYTDAIMCWQGFQNGFGKLTTEQQETLYFLAQNGAIELNYSCYPEMKQEMFAERAKEIHEEAILMNKTVNK